MKDYKELLKTANAAIDHGNHEKFLTYCTDDTRWEFIGEQVLKGKAAVLKYMQQNYLTPPVNKVEQLISEANKLVATGTITLKDKSGKSNTSKYCDVWTIKDGKLDQLQAFVVPIG